MLQFVIFKKIRSKLLFTKQTRNRIFSSIVGKLGYFLISLIGLSCKKIFNVSVPLPTTPVIFAFWHDELLMQGYYYMHARSQNKACVMISEYFAGDVIANIILNYNVSSIRGATNKNGSRVLIQAIRKMKNDSFDVIITPDGPIGPRHSITDGIVMLAQATGYPIVCLNYDSNKKWRTKTWDKFIIPKPFSTITFTSSDLLYLNDISLEEAKQKLHIALMKNVSVE